MWYTPYATKLLLNEAFLQMSESLCQLSHVKVFLYVPRLVIES